MIVVTSDLGRVTTLSQTLMYCLMDCGDVRSRTSYNSTINAVITHTMIVVTSDLGRVTTKEYQYPAHLSHCGDVRSRTSYNF